MINININIYTAQIPCEYDQIRVTNKLNKLNRNKLIIPTGGRLTSWLFTQRGGVELGTTEGKSIQSQGGGFQPGTSVLQIQRPTTRPRSPPFSLHSWLSILSSQV